MTQALPQSTSRKNVRVVRAEPDVKSIKTRELFNAGVSASAQIGKSADPTCYNAATVELRTGLFENVERDMSNGFNPVTKLYGVVGRSADGARRVYGQGKTQAGAVSEAMEAAQEYVGRRRDQGPLSNWTFGPASTADLAAVQFARDVA